MRSKSLRLSHLKTSLCFVAIMKPRGPSKVRVPSQKIPSFPGVGEERGLFCEALSYPGEPFTTVPALTDAWGFSELGPVLARVQ